MSIRQRCFALVPAAGMGKRMGASQNKQYLLLQGKPILARTLQTFQDSQLVDGIILIIPAEERDYCQREVVDRYRLTKVLEIVAGGAERQYSVMNGLLALRRYAVDEDIILIHDGVRPFIDEALLHQVVELAACGVGALVAVPAKDTIKIVRNNTVVDTHQRSELWQAQTPQGFRFDLIFTAHQRAADEAFLGTDDCSLLERCQLPVQVVRGSYRNIKITTPEDLLVAEQFLTASEEGHSR